MISTPPEQAQYVVPVLTLRDTTGRIDVGANAAYAQRAAETWIDAFIVAGTIGDGETLPERDRQQVLDIWQAHVPAGRLLGCAWDMAEATRIAQDGVRPLAVMRNLGTIEDALEFLGALPDGAYVYSHPKYSPVRYTLDITTEATAAGVLPDGGKLCKISLYDITELRIANDPRFALFDGRCRHVAQSMEAGATGVIAVPLCGMPDLPDRSDVAAVQELIDTGQARLDQDTDHASRIRRLSREAAVSLAG